MAAGIVCPPGTRRIGMECIPHEGEPAGRSDIEYYKQYQQDLPQYQTPGQGTYTGPGTGAFHPFYGVTGKSQSAGVLSTPYVEGAPGYAGGHTGYSPYDLLRGHRVQETPKRMDAPYSFGDPYAQGGNLYNMGNLLGAGGGTPVIGGGAPFAPDGSLLNMGDLLGAGGGIPAGRAGRGPSRSGMPEWRGGGGSKSKGKGPAGRGKGSAGRGGGSESRGSGGSASKGGGSSIPD